MQKTDDKGSKRRLCDRDFLFGIFPTNGCLNVDEVPFYHINRGAFPNENENTRENENSKPAAGEG